MDYRPEDIFTPQGLLADVEHDPKLDFLMNIFSIPRAFGVSGFGNPWNVGQHSFATALIALFWAKFINLPALKRDQLVVMALTHDLHEAVTGDILPMFKADAVRPVLDRIQGNIQRALGVTVKADLQTHLKIADLIAFLYEIKQVSPNILHTKKLALAHKIADKQLALLMHYCDEHGVPQTQVQ